ncbi:MAG TPA: cyclic nucleotide-binding domain-containing protein [Acidimicrobiales bacterium]|jgi:CRP-like cAMP-binding protein
MSRGTRKREDVLATVPLFSACAKKDLSTIARVADEVTAPAGKELVREGDTGHEFFLILDGKATVRRDGEDVATLGSGGFFGEMALLDRLPRSASVIADTDMRLLVIGRREFGGVIDEVPGLGHKLLQAMAHRLREADARAFSH